jgi:hypothetical protein
MSVQSANQTYQEYYTIAASNVSDAPRVVFQVILPAGTWVIAGSVVLDASGGAITGYNLYTDARGLSSVAVTSGGFSQVRVPVSTLVYTDGNYNFTITAQCSNAGGGWKTNGNDLVECYRITNF